VEYEAPSTKFQIPNKLQAPNSNDRNSFVLDFGAWNLFGIWCLKFGILVPLAPHALTEI
jgi:hypothetical protein